MSASVMNIMHKYFNLTSIFKHFAVTVLNEKYK